MRWLYFLTAASSIVTALVGAQRNLFGVWMAIITAILGIVVILYGSLAHYEESRIYHPNLRTQKPQPTSVRSLTLLS